MAKEAILQKQNNKYALFSLLLPQQQPGNTRTKKHYNKDKQRKDYYLHPGEEENLCVFNVLLMNFLNLLFKKINMLRHLLDVISLAPIFFVQLKLLFCCLRKKLHLEKQYIEEVPKWSRLFYFVRDYGRIVSKKSGQIRRNSSETEKQNKHSPIGKTNQVFLLVVGKVIHISQQIIKPKFTFTDYQVAQESQEVPKTQNWFQAFFTFSLFFSLFVFFFPHNKTLQQKRGRKSTIKTRVIKHGNKF